MESSSSVANDFEIESRVVAETAGIVYDIATDINVGACDDVCDDDEPLPGEIACDNDYLSVSNIAKRKTSRKLQIKTIQKTPAGPASMPENQVTVNDENIETTVTPFKLDESFDYDVYSHKSKFP
jgi:hypothetical protein